MSQKTCSWLTRCAYLASICCTALLIIACYALPAQADVIYHAFNQKFQDVKTELPELKEIGYSYIQVSPPQKSNPAPNWWGRYQPLDYVICSDNSDKNCPLGNENDLKELIDSAHNNGQKIIVDIVFNHMANYKPNVDTLSYPPLFSSEDFHNQTCISNFNDRYQVTHGWLGCDLPDLKTETSDVKDAAKEYLKHLVSLGADGFRFDATKHIDRDFFREVLDVVSNSKFYYGEVLGENMADYNQYTDFMSVTDDKLFHTLFEAINYNGDLRSLVNPQDTNRALPGYQAVTYAHTHDIVNNNGGEGDYKDKPDALLASAYVLAIREGFPLIYRDDAKEDIVKAGVKFREKMMNQTQYFRNGNEIAPGADNPNTLFIERGGKGLAILNKSGEFFDVKAAKMPGLETGCYKELRYNFPISVDYGEDGNKYINKWGDKNRGGIQIGPRDVLFFTQTYADDCTTMSF
ncbi:alpha-amylase family protein [Limnoraphis robusta Tam1]|uniref:alpha-amylase family protein n=1 Tax=Limnoraphis robusta TaxID=1118279 RepID=UPI002B1F7412|nr:alpha-amylase family protein [Limnoraphis robusta]MEA5542726.1 alpha-amylase family protein [Limnoraphis robusta Tam1]